MTRYRSSDSPSLQARLDGEEVHETEWQGYSVIMFRDPNSGHMRFEIDVPEGYEDTIAVDVNEERVYG